MHEISFQKRNALAILFAGIFLHGAAPALGAAAVNLVEDGKSGFTIVSPSRGRPGVEWAIGEIVRYIEKMSGCRLGLGEAGGGGSRLVVGLRGDLAEADRAALPDRPEGHDGYAILVEPPEGSRPPRIIIAGENGRGVVYGAYDLLERLGCRWYYPGLDPEDPEVVPRRGTLSLEAARRSAASPLKYRVANASAWFFDVDPRTAALELDWAMKNRYNAMGWQCNHRTPVASQYRALEAAGLFGELAKRDMILHGPGHSFDQFLRAEDHMKDHPEWFGLRDGKRVPQNFLGAQFCWSNAEARGKFAEGVEAFVQACPAIGILCMVPFDGGRACACERCAAAGSSNLLMKLLGEVMERLAVRSPQVIVEAVGGYGPASEPPASAAIHPRQRVLWAHWGRYHKTGYDDPAYGLKANLETWRKAARAGFTVCQYYTDNFCQPWILPPFAEAIRGDRRYILSSGIDGIYVLMWPKGYWWNHGLNGLLAGRCFYDASLDPSEAIRDYALHYFGEKAGPLLGAYLEEWAREVELAYRVRDGAVEGDRAKLALERKAWIDPAVAAVKEDPVLSRRVGKVEKLHDLAERLAGLHWLREEVQAARKAGEDGKARELLQGARARTEEVLARMGALAGHGEGLIDKDEVSGFISLILKGRIDEEEKALEKKEKTSPSSGDVPARR